ncbi:hypothetical protein Tco_1439864 [Tanacetum coccineum]
MNSEKNIFKVETRLYQLQEQNMVISHEFPKNTLLYSKQNPKNNDEHQPRLSNFFKNFDSNGGDDLCYPGGLDQSNPTSIISDETIANPNAQIVGDDMVRVLIPRYMSWLDYDEHVDSLKVRKGLSGTPIEVEPLNETKLEEVGLNCNHNTPLSSREVPSFDGPEPQPLLNSPSLDVSLGDVIGPEPPIKPHSPNSSRMKVVDYLTTQTPPSPHVANSHPKGVYSYYNPGIDDPKRHYGFKPGLLGKSVSLGVDISNWEMFDDDWRLESKEVSPLGEELSLFDRPNKVERGRILEAHRLEPILQQQNSQRMAPSHHGGLYRYYHPHLNSSVGEPSPLSVK